VEETIKGDFVRFSETEKNQKEEDLKCVN